MVRRLVTSVLMACTDSEINRIANESMKTKRNKGSDKREFPLATNISYKTIFILNFWSRTSTQLMKIVIDSESSLTSLQRNQSYFNKVRPSPLCPHLVSH